MSDLLQEQEREINECLKTHLIQMTSSFSTDKFPDWKRMFAYLTLLMEYEFFLFMIRKENLDLMQRNFDLVFRSLADTREGVNEGFKSCSETQLKKLEIIFFRKSQNYAIGESLNEEAEMKGKIKETQNDFQSISITKST